MWDTMTERAPQHAAGRSPKAREDCLKHPAWCPASTRVQACDSADDALVDAGEGLVHVQFWFGGGADLVEADAGGELAENQPVLGDVDHRQVGDDAVHHPAA